MSKNKYGRGQRVRVLSNINNGYAKAKYAGELGTVEKFVAIYSGGKYKVETFWYLIQLDIDALRELFDEEELEPSSTE